MTIELAVTPSGQLAVVAAEPPDNTTKPEIWCKSVEAAFAADWANGLFELASIKTSGSVSPSASFWRAFARQYMSELVKTPESAGTQLSPIKAPPVTVLQDFLSNLPPMRGAEYMRTEVLETLWNGLDIWVRNEISNHAGSLGDWLKVRGPQWHQVGRVCFHLAENKRDEEHPFAFLATYAPQLSQSGTVQYLPLSRALNEYAGSSNNEMLIKLLSPVYEASEKSALAKELIESHEIFHPLLWTSDQAYRFLREVPVLEDSGILVRLPDWWRKRPRPRVNITIGEKKKNTLGMGAMLDFKVSLALGEIQLSVKEIQQLMNAQEGLVFLKGQWVEVDRERLSEALEHWRRVEKKVSENGISFIEGMRLLAGASASLDGSQQNSQEESQWSHVNAGTWLQDILSGLRDPGKLVNVQQSEHFKGVLRPYQKMGHDWLWFLSNLGLGACLADDMGLGKTVQVLSLLLSIKDNLKISPRKPSLLVLPASLLSNWKSELERFAPTLSACFLHPSECPQDKLSSFALQPEKAISSYDAVFTTYGMLLRQEWLADVDWNLVILDEAQTIKNPSAGQTRAVKKLRAQARIALTGTPVENRLGDLWSLFDFLSPGLLGSADKFRKFIKHLDGQDPPNYAPLRNLVGPYILRRLKSDKRIITDLPDKTELKVFCGLAPEQAALYSKSVQDLKESLNKLEGEDIKRRGLVLSFLLKFKQICNHPSQLFGDGVYEPKQSGKFERLRIIADEIASRQEKVIVFTQFKEMTEPLAAFLKGVFGRPGLVLHGETAVSKRKGIVDAFQKPDGPPFVVLSLKAGGTGLNLTAASHVVHFDRWWNPAVENQATDRAYRIGQHRNVLVHKFVCRGTIEEKIDQLISEKTVLADGILTGGAESKLTEMSDKELLEIVSLDIQRVSLE